MANICNSTDDRQTKVLFKSSNKTKFKLIRFSGFILFIEIFLVVVGLLALYFTQSIGLLIKHSFWVIIAYVSVCFLLFSIYYGRHKSQCHIAKLRKSKKYLIARVSQKIELKANRITEDDVLNLSNGDVVPVDVKLRENVSKRIVFRHPLSKRIYRTSPDNTFIPAGSLLICGGRRYFQALSSQAFSLYTRCRHQIKHYVNTTSYLYHKFPLSNQLFLFNLKLTLVFVILLVVFILILIQSKLSTWYFLLQFSIEIMLIFLLDNLMLFLLLNTKLVCRSAPIMYRDIEAQISLALMDTLIILSNNNNNNNRIEKTSSPTDDPKIHDFTIPIENMGNYTQSDCHGNQESILSRGQFCLSAVWIDGHILEGDETTVSQFEESSYSVKQSPTWTALTRDSVLCNQADMSPWTLDRPRLEQECISNTSIHDRKCNYKHNYGTDDSVLLDESLLISFNQCDSVRKWGDGSLPRYRENNTTLWGPCWDEQTQCKMSVHQLNDGDSRLLLILQGNVESVINCTNTLMMNGKAKNMDENVCGEIRNAYEKLWNRHGIVRAFADMRLSPDEFPHKLSEFNDTHIQKLPRKGLRLIGLVGFSDSLKSNTESSIRSFQDNGVSVVVASSGDNSDEFRLLNKSDITCCHVDFANLSTNVEDNLDSNLSPSSHTVLQVSNISDTRLMFFIENLKKEFNRNVGVAAISSFYSYLPMLSANISISSDNQNTNIMPSHPSNVDAILKTNALSDLIDARQHAIQFLVNFKTVVSFLYYPKLTMLLFYCLFVFGGCCLPINLSWIIGLLLCSLFPLVILPFCDPINDKSVESNQRSPYKYKKILSNNRFNKYTVSSISHWIHPRFFLVLEIGSIQMIGALLTYFVMMGINGFLPGSLFRVKNIWYASFIDDLEDSYMQEWTYAQRMDLTREVTSAVFMTVITLQMISALLTVSIYQSFVKYCCRIKVLILTAVLLYAVGLYFIYFGAYFEFMEFNFINYIGYILILPSALYLIIYIEVKKLIMRHWELTFCDW